MAQTMFGTLQEFQPDVEPIKAYLERANVFFEANSIAADKRVPVLLSAIGPRIYSLLRNLTSPAVPHEKSFDELSTILQSHFQPKPLLIAERFHFHRRDQAADESIAEYVAELRRLSTNCEFGATLNDALRDRLVCGMRNTSAQKRLLAEADLTFKKALELSQGMEAAEKNSKALKGTEAAVKKLSIPLKNSRGENSTTPKSTCYRCGRGNHNARSCRFADATCHKCGKKGHIAPVCRSAKKPQRSGPRKSKESPRTKYVATTEDDGSATDEFQLYTIGAKAATRPIIVDVQINGKQLLMEVDTGAALSIISEQTWKTVLPGTTLKKADIVLTTYTNERMTVMGELLVQVAYKQQCERLPIVVVTGDGPSLLGRLDWNSICTITRADDEMSLKSLLRAHEEIFKDELGTVRSLQATLHVRPDARPKFFKSRTVPFAIKGAIEQELDRLETNGVIRKVSHSEWAAPIVPVPKKDGKFRICGDYKVTINQALDVDQYPLPKPEDLFATLAGGKTFSKLDLSQAYQQLRLDEESAKYVTVNTHRGLYRYNRLPFGIASAPALFQKLMDTVLQGIPHVICYIDDILVTGVNNADHLRNLASVLQQLKHYGFRLKKNKCEFLMSSVEYLGHRIDAEGLHAMPSKLQAIVQAPAPKNVQELRSFLGLLNYYGKFIPNLASLIQPLNNLLQHKRKWKWTTACNNAFQQAKEELSSSQVLVHYDPALPLTLAGDASAYGIGAVISHIMPDGTERPIAFASRSLSPSERNYAQLEKEALSLIFGVKKFHQYLYGRKFTLVTDHKPLTAILGAKKGIPSLAAARLQRWAVLLSAYQYEIQFKSTSDHANADGLSRLPLSDSKEASVVCSSEPSVFNISQIESLPVTAAQVEAATRTDPILSKVLHYTKQGWPRTQQSTEALKPFRQRSQELTVEGGCLLWGMRVVIPKKLQGQILQELHRDHPGASRMKSSARSYFWWPGLDKEIENLAKSCLACQSVRHAPATAPLHPWVWPSRPWQRIHVDFAGPFLGKSFLVVVDAHSKWPEVFEMSSTTASKTIATLRHLFSAYGLPEQLVSDNGPQFVSEEFQTFMKQNGVKHIRCAPYHPSSNGAAERFIQTFKQAMKASEKDGHSVSHRLANFLMTYRSTPHTTTNVAPCTLFLQREIRTRFHLLQPDPERTVCAKQAEQVTHHDQHAKQRSFQIGQKVMVKNMRPGPDWIPAVIAQQLGPVSFLVDVESGLRWKRHIDHIRELADLPMITPQANPQTSDDTDTFISPSLTSSSDNQDQAHVPQSASTPTVTQSEDSNQGSRYPSRIRHPPDRLM